MVPMSSRLYEQLRAAASAGGPNKAPAAVSSSDGRVFENGSVPSAIYHAGAAGV